ncbi:hypothetical protein K488DRAFT_89073 [Vararia minispora EC-137]|uniref:Uncharacterized protein n=1 Tax=Vararia minispora EC-137 TaxID=1314806 RepID=A0ACB8QBS2_9AGAM|nr:hypothetical protein K488DRAFT_89073 [Vararia minispora EC-137]
MQQGNDSPVLLRLTQGQLWIPSTRSRWSPEQPEVQYADQESLRKQALKEAQHAKLKALERELDINKDGETIRETCGKAKLVTSSSLKPPSFAAIFSRRAFVFVLIMASSSTPVSQILCAEPRLTSTEVTSCIQSVLSTLCTVYTHLRTVSGGQAQELSIFSLAIDSLRSALRQISATGDTWNSRAVQDVLHDGKSYAYCPWWIALPLTSAFRIEFLSLRRVLAAIERATSHRKMYRTLLAQHALPNPAFARAYGFSTSAIVPCFQAVQHSDPLQPSFRSSTGSLTSLQDYDLDTIFRSLFPSDILHGYMPSAPSPAPSQHQRWTHSHLPSTWLPSVAPPPGSSSYNAVPPAQGKSIEETVDVVIYMMSLLKDAVVLIAHVGHV